jgi:hypothetical protein
VKQHGVTVAAVAMFMASAASAAALSQAEIAKLCGEAEGQAHCGRLVEAEQLKRLPGLAQRDGDTLRISLFPSGQATFTDVETTSGGTSYALWDHYSTINATLLFTTTDDDSRFVLLHRSTGKQSILPSAPAVSQDRQRLATADFCETRCENRLVVWRLTANGALRETEWRPAQPWSDAAVTWKDPNTLTVEYSLPEAPETKTLERRLNDPGWQPPGR